MTANATVSTCPNCGAPLELDAGGRCRWCNALVQMAPPAGAAPTFFLQQDDQLDLVPASAREDDLTLAPFVGLILTALELFKREPAVQDYLNRAPGLREAIRSLSLAVSAAGRRARDSKMHSQFDDSLRYYTPAEVWIFDLAVDVIAMLGSLEGLRGGTRAQIRDNLRTLHQDANFIWRMQVKKAGEGPEAFRQMRAQIPHDPHHKLPNL